MGPRIRRMTRRRRYDCRSGFAPQPVACGGCETTRSTSIRTPSRSRGAMRPRLERFTLEKRGRRECRALAAPAVPCAMGVVDARTSIQGQRKHSGIPYVAVLRLMPCSPRRRIRFCHRRWRIKAARTRSGRLRLRQLDLSNGCQAHTVLPYAQASFVVRACDPSRGSTRPVTAVHANALASTTSRPTFVTTRDRPSCRNRMGIIMQLIWDFGKAEICPSCQFVAALRIIRGCPNECKLRVKRCDACGCVAPVSGRT
jgi:hypothetical protein